MKQRQRLLAAISQRLELPSDVVAGDPGLELKGRGELTVHGHRGLIGYAGESVSVATGLGVLEIEGGGLRIHRMNREDIVLYGRIDAIRFREKA